MYNALSIDLEFWYSGEPFIEYARSTYEDQVEAATEPILKLFKENDIHATFFVLGEVAEKYPELIKTIQENGHEIASHGFTHKRLHLSDKNSFSDDILHSKKILKNLTGEYPIGYRAPSFSLDNSTIWALDVLKTQGFLYDSSLYPVKMRFYGEPNVPLSPYHPSSKDIMKIDNSNPFLEFPVTVFSYRNKYIPISGGFCFRIIPTSILTSAFRKVNQERPVLVYIHPWESYAETPKLDLPIWWRFTSYYNAKHLLTKLEHVVHHMHFTTIRETLNLP